MAQPKKIKVAIDLTPLRPGGENGGAKTLVTTLLKDFSICHADQFEYLMIAEPWNYEELKQYQADNMVCKLRSEIYSNSPHSLVPVENNMVEPNASSPHTPTFSYRLESLVRRAIGFSKKKIKGGLAQMPRLKGKVQSGLLKSQKLTGKVLNRLDRLFASVAIKRGPLQKIYSVDLLFCPFSAPTLAEYGLPLVAIAYDLQHLDLPFFFPDDERFHRTRFLADLVRKSDKVICISEFTRQSFLTYFESTPEQFATIPICIHERLQQRPLEQVNLILKAKNIGHKPYLFFPANFWPHKNHRLLLAAYSIYRHRLAADSLDLVFTGALEGPQIELKEHVTHLGYEQSVHFLGFLNQDELIAIWQGAHGLIFPSLYEGFGIPLLEAMWFDKPIACSNVGSLPEVGGKAVIYFDPRNPEAVADAIACLGHDPTLTTQLRKTAKQQLQHFKRSRMTERYLSTFDAVLPGP